MAPAQQSGVQMTVTKINRSGSATIELGQETSFKWDGLSHSSMQGVLQMKIGTKIVRKVMPGSNQVVHQALAAAWDPMTLKGEWRDIWMGAGQAKRTWLAFALMCEKLPLVRMTIDGISFVGMIQDPEFTYHHEAWIEWSFTLSPEKNETVTEGAFFGIGSHVIKKSISQWFQEALDLQSQLRSLADESSDIPLATEDMLTSVASLDELDDSMSRVGTLSTIQGSADQVSNTNDVGTDVTDTTWALPAAYKRTQNASLNVGISVNGQRADLALGFDNFVLALRYARYIHQTTSLSWKIAGHAFDAAQDMKHRASQKPKAIYIPKPGESLERISMQFYGTPDNAALIYRTNHLTSIVLAGTEELFIPEVGA